MKNLWNNRAKSVGLNMSADIPDTEKEFVFHYSFDGNLTDSSDNNYPLVSAGHTFAEGKIEQSLCLNDNGQYVDFNTTGTVDTQNMQYTVFAWIYDDATEVPASVGSFRRDEW